MPRPKREGSVRVANFLEERMRAVGVTIPDLARIIAEEEPPEHRVSEKTIYRILKTTSGITLQGAHVLGRYLRFHPARILDLVWLDRYNDLAPRTDDPGELDAIAKDAFQVGNYPLAFVSYEKLTAVTKGVDSALARYYLAFSMRRLGLIDAANETFRAVLQFPDLDDERRAGVLTAIATCYEIQGCLEDSVIYSRRALELPVESQTRCSILISLGNAFADRFDLYPPGNHAHLDEAVEVYSQALTIARDIGDRRRECTCLANVARCKTIGGNPAEGVEGFAEARKIAVTTGDAWLLAFISAEMGKAHLLVGDLQKAKWNLQVALNKSDDYPDLKVFAALLLWQIAVREGASPHVYQRIARLHRWRVQRKTSEIAAYDAQQGE